MPKMNIQFSRFSAFYSPLISVVTAGLLEQEGYEGVLSVAPPGRSGIQALQDGSADVVQAAVSAAFGPLLRGETPPAVHFAQINERDGFFLVGRDADPSFSWSKLAGAEVLVDHGGQPLAMFKYACHKAGVDYGAIKVVDAGTPEEMAAAFAQGQGGFVHLQGPAAQQTAQDSGGAVVAAVGRASGRLAFSSMAATTAWLETDAAAAFMRAFRKARAYVMETEAAEIARQEAPHFPGIDGAALAATIAAYQELGTWSPPIEISREGFEAAVDVFVHAGNITERPDYDKAVVPPPA